MLTIFEEVEQKLKAYINNSTKQALKHSIVKILFTYIASQIISYIKQITKLKNNNKNHFNSIV